MTTKVKYWDITETDVYIRVFNRIFQEIDTNFLDQIAVKSYQGLHVESRYLVTRLYYRARKYIAKSDLLNYLPAEKVDDRISELLATNWFIQPTSLEDILEAANLKELTALATRFGVKSTTKLELKNQLASKCAIKASFGQKPLSVRIIEKFTTEYSYYKLNDLGSILQKAFFLYLIPSYGATDDILVRKNMGLVTYLEYEYFTQKERPVFTSRTHFEEYYEARTLCDDLEEGVGPEVLATKMAAINELVFTHELGGRYTGPYVVGRAIHLVARLLGKQGDFYTEYQWTKRYLAQTFHSGKRNENRIRKLMLELKFFADQKDPVWLRCALNTYFDAMVEMDDVSLLDLERKGQRLMSLLRKNNISSPDLFFNTKITIPIRDEVATLNAPTGNRTSWGESNATVEQIALEIYAREGWQGGHFENGTLSTFLMLLVQDIVFDHKESFLNEIQTGPMSMGKALAAKSEQVTARVAGNMEAVITEHHAQFYEKCPQIAGVNWEIPLDCLLALARHPKARALVQALLDRKMSTGSSSGFPDLTLWNDTGIKFVEVKSTNDVMSDSQYIWIKTLLELGFEAEICKIRDNRKRKRPVADPQESQLP